MANKLNVVRRKYPLVRFLLNIEYKCFGYRTHGKSSETIHEGYEGSWNSTGDTYTVREKTHTNLYAYYKRHEDYPTNFLFNLVSFIDNILSRIRLLLFTLLPIAIIFTLIVNDPELTKGVFSVYSFVYIANIVTMILGVIIRRIFKLDKKMDEICDKNNWKRWSDYKNVWK